MKNTTLIISLLLFSKLYLFTTNVLFADEFSKEYSLSSAFDDLLSQEIKGQDKYDYIIKSSTNSVLIITADEIKKFGFTTLKEVINYASDYYFSYDGS